MSSEASKMLEAFSTAFNAKLGPVMPNVPEMKTHEWRVGGEKLYFKRNNLIIEEFDTRNVVKIARMHPYGHLLYSMSTKA